MTESPNIAMPRKTLLMPISEENISATGIFPWLMDSASICIDIGANESPDENCESINPENLEN